MNNPHRRFLVLASLVAFMSATAALLLALAPQPLAPDLPQSLSAAMTAQNAMSAVFETDAPVQPGAWKYIHVRHSKTRAGDAMSLTGGHGDPGDHFVICNGQGGTDGEVQMTPRWLAQLSALPPRGAESIDPQCISICLVGDFDAGSPTATQIRRLSQLVSALQTRLEVPARNVIVQSVAGTPAAAGARFPASDFRSRIRD